MHVQCVPYRKSALCIGHMNDTPHACAVCALQEECSVHLSAGVKRRGVPAKVACTSKFSVGSHHESQLHDLGFIGSRFPVRFGRVHAWDDSCVSNQWAAHDRVSKRI